MLVKADILILQDAERPRHEKRIVDSKANKESLAEYAGVVSFNLNATMIRSVLLLERNHEIQSGIESRVVVVVFEFRNVLRFFCVQGQ